MMAERIYDRNDMSGSEDKTSEDTMASGKLGDDHVWMLAERITSKQDLLDLGLKVLHLPGFTIDSSLYNQRDIELAANAALDLWRKNQRTPEEAYENLHQAFLDNDWINLAEELRFWVEGKTETKVSEERFKDIRKSVKQSLLHLYENFMSVDWLPETDVWTFPSEVYTEPCWTRIVREGMEDTTISIGKLIDIFGMFAEGSKIIVEGEAGSGKSSAMSKLAVDWAKSEASEGSAEGDEQAKSDEPAKRDEPAKSNESTTILNDRFDLVLLILLKNVRTDDKLSKLIIDQHHLNKQGTEISEDEINFILQDRGRKLLFIFDGYNDYRKGTNSAIDATIAGKTGNSFILITSRPDYMDKVDITKLDGEIQIRGFDDKSVQECALKYFQGEKNPKEQMKKLIKKVKKRGVLDLVRIPMLTADFCIIYFVNKGLPKGEQLLGEVLQIYIKRAKEKGCELEDTDRMVRALAELSCEASETKTRIQKGDVESKCSDILKLGLLHTDMSPRKAKTGTRTEPECLSFPSAMLQEVLIKWYKKARKTNDFRFMSGNNSRDASC